MRIWSLNPQYIDSKGLVALWRETLLAQHVLEGKTKGYRNHPQLIRFKETQNPTCAINQYLAEVYREAERRGFHFSKDKINWEFTPQILTVTKGQMQYERAHLLKKLETRDPQKYADVISETDFPPHPMFEVVAGEIEHWERTDVVRFDL